MPICGKSKLSLLSPKAGFLWRIIPPYICWHIWKERNKKIFKEEEKTKEVFMGIMEKLVKENIRIVKRKTPKEEPGRKEGQIVEKWGIQGNFYHFDNSKVLKR